MKKLQEKNLFNRNVLLLCVSLYLKLLRFNIVIITMVSQLKDKRLIEFINRGICNLIKNFSYFYTERKIY